MNFKILFFLLSILFIFGCGVKAKPLTPAEKAIPSYINSYTQDNEQKVEQKTEQNPEKK